MSIALSLIAVVFFAVFFAVTAKTERLFQREN